jgi:hypothetical protein
MNIDKLIAEAHSAITRTKGKEYAPTAAEIQLWLEKNGVQISNRKAIFSELAHYDHLSKPDDYIEVTEWSNGEGFDVEVSGNIDSRFQLTWGQYEAMKALIKTLEGNDED